jgi:redox-sensitive bicupin YhaK (pirin superfamily)
LRVINEDRVEPGEGFGEHPHRDYEIFSYILSGNERYNIILIRSIGELEHKDSMGNLETIQRGGIQFTVSNNT